ncbi:MAG: PDZ domain-containing protein, partial [Planctomycetales bacterium]|nr:PDZ domain-containing protein [Planctomycetales bacterium]
AGVKPHTSAAMTVVRDGKRVALNVKIGLLDESVAATAGGGDAAGQPGDAQDLKDWGLTVRTLTPESAAQYGLAETQKGVVVTDVAADSVAAGSLRPGDVILDVNGHAVASVEQFSQALAAADLARGVRMHVGSDGFQRFVFLQRN